MTDAVDRRYEEAVAEAEKGLASPSQVRSVLDAIGFRALLEIEEAAQTFMRFADENSPTSVGQTPMTRLRAALAARATAAFIRYYENRD